MFYVYEKWRARGHRVVIHLSSCGFCNAGKGTSTRPRPDNGKWHGPFSGLEDATDFSRAIENNFQNCAVCLKKAQ